MLSQPLTDPVPQSTPHEVRLEPVLAVVGFGAVVSIATQCLDEWHAHGMLSMLQGLYVALRFMA